MPNMDLNTFYHHALQWQNQQAEADRLQAEQMAEHIRDAWKDLADCIRVALPIEGMSIHETYACQFSEFPRKGYLIDLDCVLDPLVKGAHAQNKGELMAGVIRVRLYWNDEDAEPSWKPLKFVVWVDGKATEFDNPYEAFIKAYSGMNINS